MCVLALGIGTQDPPSGKAQEWEVMEEVSIVNYMQMVISSPSKHLGPEAKPSDIIHMRVLCYFHKPEKPATEWGAGEMAVYRARGCRRQIMADSLELPTKAPFSCSAGG